MMSLYRKVVVNLRRTIKKHYYLGKRAIKGFLVKSYRGLKYYFVKQDPFEIDILETYKLSYPAQWKKFGRYPLIVEIGTGHGELMQFLAKKNPEKYVIGFEVTKTYTKKTNKKINGYTNAKVFNGNGYECFTNLFEDNSVDKLYILFPDPWHKKSHHKRRPISTEWLIEAAGVIKPGGFLYFATDWDEYYQYVMSKLEAVNKQKDLFVVETAKYDPNEQGLVATHYYNKWLEAGRSFDYIRAVVK